MKRNVPRWATLVALIMIPWLQVQAQYCTPDVFFFDDEDIQNVTFNTINNTSPSLCETYTDYTSISTTVNAGASYSFSVNTADCEGIDFYDRSVVIWIDFNQNDDFEDPGEMVFVDYQFGAATVLFTGSITIPVGATPGTTGMRVACIEDDAVTYPYTSCDVIFYGEVEDYTINIVSTACISPPTAGTATISDPTPCPGVNFTLGITGGTVGVGQTYQWQSSPDNVTWSNIPGATSVPYITTLSDTTWYRCIVTCSALSDTTTAVSGTPDSYLACSCIPTTTYGCGIDYIDNVTFETINNTTGCTGSYTDYTSMTTVNVIQGSSYPISVTTDGDTEGIGIWVDFNQNGIFEASEFVFTDFLDEQPAEYNTTILIPGSATPGLTRMRIRCKYNNVLFPAEACGNLTYGETEDYLLNIQAPPADEGGLVSLLSPSAPPLSGCSVSDTIKAIFTTVGTNPLTSLDFNYSVNGGPTVTVAWTGTLTAGQTDTFMVGVTTLVDGDNFELWVSDPNGVTDTYTSNDSIILTLYDAMSGVYTIGGASPDFATINDAVDALETRGLCGAVTMNIRAGSYTEQASIGLIPGASATRTVTFQSEAMDASTVSIDFNGDPVNNYVFQLDGTHYVTLYELTISNAMSYYSRVIDITNNATHNTVENCVIIGDTMTSTTTFDRSKVVVWSGADLDHYTTLRGNDIRGGEWAIGMWGNDETEIENGLVLENNTISDYYQAGFVGVYLNRPVVKFNRMLPDTNNFNTNMFHLDVEEGFGGVEMIGNLVDTRQGGFGINLFNIEANGALPGVVANNFIYMGNTSATTYNEGIAVQDCSNEKIVFNSVHSRSMTATSAGVRLFMGTSSSITVMNNNMVNSGGGYALNSDNVAYMDIFDHNNFYTDSASGKFVRIAGDYANLNALQTATGTNANSFSVNPGFSGSDLHTCRMELDAAALPFAGITTDYDGDTRNMTTPDIGADEFISPAHFYLGDDIIKCPNDTVLLGAEIIGDATYYWAPFFQTTPVISATDDGIYVVQVTSSCGVAVDSIMITNLPLPTASFSTTQSFYTVITDNNSTNAVEYIWDFGDGNFSTEYQPSHVYATNGTYTITLTAISECGDTAVFTRIVTVNPQFAGVEEENGLLVNIYPNPSDGNFNIYLQAAEENDITLSIFDLSGRMVYNNTIGGKAGELTTQMNLAGTLSSGTYILRISSGKYTGMTRIIIK